MKKVIEVVSVFLAVDADGTEKLFGNNHGVTRMAEYDKDYNGPNIYTPRVDEKTYWGRPSCGGSEDYDAYIELPKGSIKKLIGKELTWKDELFEYCG